MNTHSINDERLSGEPASGEAANGEAANGEAANGEPANGEPANGEAANGEPANGEPANGEPANGEAANGEPANGEPANGEPANGEPANGEPAGDGLESFSAMLRAALGDLLAPGADSFAEMMASDAVMEFPFAPAGSVARVEGRAALERYLSGFGEILRIDRMTGPTVHRGREAGVVILEFGCVGIGVQTGAPYNQTYISVITLRDGRIAHYRDYWNPLVVLAAVGGADAVNAAIQAEVR